MSEQQQEGTGSGSSEQQQPATGVKPKKERIPKELTEEQRLKKEEAERKAKEKQAKKEQAKQQRGVKESVAVVKVTVEEIKAGTKLYGEYPLIQSTEKIGASKSITGFDFVEIKQLDKSFVGQTVALRTRVFTVRGSGNAAFLLLRSGFFTAQATLFAGGDIPKDLVKYAAKLSKETVIEIVAQVNAAPEPIKSASQQDVELAIKRLYIVSAAQALPFLVEDAMKSDALLEEEAATASAGSATTTTSEPKAVSRDVRLDNRIIDLRAPAHIAIFKIQSAVGMLFREFLYTKGFMEIHSPKLIGTASEGGADVFQVKYFGGFAYLAQSPQLYKQMAVESDFMRVFEIAPVFRAENSHTHRHLTEFMGLDLEMEIKHHYSEVLDVLDELFVYIFEGLQTRFAKELEVINEQYPFKPISYTPKNNLRLTYPEAIKLLREDGEEIGDLDDLSTAQERRLGRVVKEKHGTDFYMLERFPLQARPFYTMPCPDNEDYSNSYDLFLRGEEIASGAQRVHDPELLLANAAKKGVNMNPIQAYVDAFKYGAWPHGGAGIGLERVVMLYLGIGNVRKVSLFPRDPKRLSP